MLASVLHAASKHPKKKLRTSRVTLNANKLSSFERRSESWTPPTKNDSDS